ncbi:MAG TPA: GIY-YIG nuclease family protein [Vineibacter sp.]|nr:GIY-YIG nuclease family protein [Vineibacter sp.]
MAILAYKERKPVVGIYAVRCAASGAIWVGRSLTLDTVQNRIWFTLRLGSSPHRDLQTAWRDHGAESFTFDVLERLADDDDVSHDRDTHLKGRVAHWRSVLGARSI